MEGLTVTEYRCQRVLTTQQIAEAYGTDRKTISYNFNHNIDRFVEGKHFIKLENEEKTLFVNRLENHDGLKNAKTIYLWTEKGAFLHAKSLNTDQATLSHSFWKAWIGKQSYRHSLIQAKIGTLSSE